MYTKLILEFIFHHNVLYNITDVVSLTFEIVVAIYYDVHS